MKAWPQAIVALAMELLGTGVCLAAERTQSGLALAYPVAGIRIDGDLSDWPAQLPRYRVNSRIVDPPTDPRDCSGEFRVGYSEVENALYVAVEVEDQPWGVIGSHPMALFEEETALVAVGIDTQEGGHLRLGFQRGESTTNTVTVQGDVNGALHAPIHFRAEMQCQESGWSYEFRIDVQSWTHGQARLCPGGKVELNVWVHDLDRWVLKIINGRASCSDGFRPTPSDA